jgi:hypothetical protein
MARKRSALITASAALVLVGSAANISLAVSLFIHFSSAQLPVSQSNVLQPSTLRHLMYAMGIVDVGLSAWGIVTGIGLLLLREWARISLIVLSAILVVIFLRAFLFMILAADVFKRSGSTRTAAGMFEVTGILLAAFWLWFLNRRTTRAQFGAATDSTPP